jgi:hypothetical protein
MSCWSTSSRSSIEAIQSYNNSGGLSGKFLESRDYKTPILNFCRTPLALREWLLAVSSSSHYAMYLAEALQYFGP